MKRIADFIATYRINRRAGCSVRESVRYAWGVAYHRCPF